MRTNAKYPLTISVPANQETQNQQQSLQKHFITIFFFTVWETSAEHKFKVS